jgi:hypothetical protein
MLTVSILTHRVDIGVVLAALFLFGVSEAFGDTTTARCCRCWWKSQIWVLRTPVP